MLFNINDYVRVKLADRGRRIISERHDEMLERFPKLGPVRYPNEDADGWSRWQLWHLMSTFGPFVRAGLEPPFSIEIEIPESPNSDS